jgi:PBP4 family serine-type D-alanyl-D-alanine carboxypeptidase
MMARRFLAACAGMAVCATVWQVPAGAAEPDPPIPPIAGIPADAMAIMNAATYTPSTWAVTVTDALTGEPLADYNGQKLVKPASATKTFSTAAYWLTFGPGSRIVTPVVRTGRVVDGALRGDLVLVAKGDVTLGGQTGPDGRVVFTDLDHNDANALPGATIADNDPLAGLESLARQVRRAGIRSVSGNVVIDDRLFRSFMFEDRPISPIVVNNNLIDLVTTPTTPGSRASIRMRPKVKPWTVRNRVRTVAVGGATSIAVEETSAGVLTVRGTVAADADPQLKVWEFSDPARFARTAFIQALERAGVRVDAPTVKANPRSRLASRSDVADLPVVARLRGLPTSEQIRYILKVSYNRGAETLVCLLAASVGSRTCDDGMPVIGQRLRELGVDPKGVALEDGSGAPPNFITTRAATSLMTAFAARPDWATWRDALPVMGVDGSIATVQTDSPAAGHVFAKTGTNGAGDLVNQRFRLDAKALSGYVQARSGRWLSMAVIVNQTTFDDIQGVFAANEDLGKIASAIWAAY